MSVTQVNFRRSVVSGLFILAAVGGMFVTSVTQRAQAESEQGVWMIISHKIVDYKFWKPVHEQSAATKRNYGWSKGAVFSIDGDRNHVMVMDHFATLERARAWSESTDFRDEMAISGVKTNSEIRFAKNLNAELIP